MTKTHAEFLEELEELVKEKWIKHGGEYLDILKKIEQFQAEKKVSDANSEWIYSGTWGIFNGC